MMLGLLLARAGVEVLVLEKHADFLRDFRGDTIHPSTLEILHELGLLEDFLKPLGVSQYRLAKAISVPARRINEIVHRKRAITADTALRLGRFFGTSERFWLNLQRDYDEAKARLRERERMLAYSPWAARFPFAAMTKHHLVEPTRARGEKIQALLRFFAVSTPDAWRQQWLEPRASFRRSPTYASRSEALSVWLRWGEREAIANTVPAFDARKLREALASLRSLTLMHPLALRQQLTEILAECGVILVLIPELLVHGVNQPLRLRAPALLSPSFMQVQQRDRHE